MAICTHPDSDHKDGFFDLLQDDDITIDTFWLTDPAQYLDVDDIQIIGTKRMQQRLSVRSGKIYRPQPQPY